MARVEYIHNNPSRGTLWGPLPGHGQWNTPHGRHRIHPKYNQDPQWVDAWRQVRQDSLDAVLGKTKGIHASPIRIPANAPHRPIGGHRGEIGDPSDSSNYLDESYEFEAVFDYINRTGWYSDENRLARILDKQNQAAAAAAPEPEPIPDPDKSLEPQQLDVSGAPAPVPGPAAAEGDTGGMPWTTGTGNYSAKGVDAGKSLFIGKDRPRYGASAHFGRKGPRLINKQINV